MQVNNNNVVNQTGNEQAARLKANQNDPQPPRQDPEIRQEPEVKQQDVVRVDAQAVAQLASESRPQEPQNSAVNAYNSVNQGSNELSEKIKVNITV